MRHRSCSAYLYLFFWILPGFCQTLPSYLVSHYPAAQAAGVPTNASIQLYTNGLYSTTTFSLKDGAGNSIPLPTIYPSGDSWVYSIRPTTTLASSTKYTFTMIPYSGATPYTFEFTTGSGPDTTGPRVVDIDPKSGSTGIGINGPITVWFDKYMDLSSLRYSGAFRVNGDSSFSGSILPTADGHGVVLRPFRENGFAPYIELTIMPPLCKDALNNAGTGDPVVAKFTTFAANPEGFRLRDQSPAAGQTGLPTNLTVRLLFSQVPSYMSEPLIQIRKDGKEVPSTISMFADNRGVTVRPADLLATNQKYQVWISDSMRGGDGMPLAEPASFEFTTGSGPDLIQGQIIEAEPSYAGTDSLVPLNSIISIRATKPFAPMVARMYTTLTGESPATVQGALSADGRTLTLTPTEPLRAGFYYSANVGEMFDTSGDTMSSSTGITFTTAAVEDHDVPAILAISPSDGSTEVRPGASVQVRFNEHIGVSPSGELIRLVRDDGQAVEGKIQWDSYRQVITFTPAAVLAGATRYRIEFGQICDLAANCTTADTTSFTTAAAASTGSQLQLLSSTPASNDRDVDPAAPIVLTFDQPLNPVTSLESARVTGSSGVVYPLRTTVAGGVATFTPVHPLPANTLFNFTFSATDTSAHYRYVGYNFMTGASSDQTPPEVVSITSSDGGQASYSRFTVTLRFSEPVDAATLNPANIIVYVRGTRINTTLTRGDDDQSVSIRIGTGEKGEATLLATSGVKDLAGNPLVPFRAGFIMPGTTSTAALPNLLELRPKTGATDAAPETSITWFLSRPVDLGAVERNLVVMADGLPVNGSYRLSAGGRAIQFSPDQPLPAGATIRFFQRQLVYYDQFSTGFTIAGSARPQHLTIVRSNLSGPPGFAPEVEFNEEPPLGQGLLTLVQNNRTIPAVESKPRPKTIRLTPISPFAVGTSYSIKLGPQLTTSIYGNWLSLYVEPSSTSNQAALVAAGPQADVSNVPLNASAQLRFNAAVNPLSVPYATLRIVSGDQVLQVRHELSADRRGLVLTPVQPLLENSLVTVSVEHLEDLLGRRIQSRTWSFHTGSELDFTAPTLIGQSVPSYSGRDFEVPPDAVFTFVFDEPVDPAMVAFSYSQDSWGLSFSDDLKTVTATPPKRLSEGTRYSLALNPLRDLSGNTSSVSALFTTGFGTSSVPPKLLAAAPADGQTNMPLNTQVLAVFDKVVTTTSLSGIRLLKNGEAVPLVRKPGLITTQVRLAPAQLLEPNTTYQLEIAGVQDASGNTMTDSVRRTFVTGDWFDASAPITQFLFTWSLPRNRAPRVRFSEPVAAASVNSESVRLVSCLSNAASCSYSRVTTGASVQLSDDNHLVTVIPDEPFAAERTYTLSVQGVTDDGGNAVMFPNGISSIDFRVTDSDDSSAPVVSISPNDGSTDLPVNIGISAGISEPIVIGETPLIQVFQGDTPLLGTVSQSAQRLRFSPALPLLPGTTYRVVVSSLTDFYGNTSAPVSATFSTRSSPAAESGAMKLVSFSPAAGAANVPADTPIVLTFDRNVDADSVNYYSVSITASPFPATGTLAVSGKTITFTPSPSLPPAATIHVQVSRYQYNYTLRDISGNRIDKTYAFSFRTATVADSEPPRLLSASPAPGTTLTEVSTSFQLSFSEPVMGQFPGLQIYAGGENISPSVYYQTGSDLRTFTLNFALIPPPDSKLTIIGTDGITDWAGNALEPFVIEYPTIKGEPQGAPEVKSVTPLRGASDVDPLTPIRLLFSKTMDAAAVINALHVTQDGVSITGKAEMQDSGHSVQFTPDAPYAAGSRIDVFLLESARDVTGLSISYRDTFFFMVATGTKTNSLTVTQASLTGKTLAVGFDRALDPGSVGDTTVWLRSGQTLVPASISMEGDRVIRVEPLDPLTRGQQYSLTLGAALRAADGSAHAGSELIFADAPEADSPALEDSAIIQTFGRQMLRLRFSAPVDELAVRHLLGTGPARLYFSVDRKEWLIAPDNPTDLEKLRREVSK